MVYPVEDDLPEKKTHKFKVQMPDITGKFGLSLFMGKREIFIGVAVAKVEIETVVRKKKSKIFLSPVKSRIVNL